MNNPEPSKKLVYQIRILSRPLPLGETESWIVQVWEVHSDFVKWPYELTAILEHVNIPDRWDGEELVPAHKEFVPGVTLGTVSMRSLGTLKKRARDRALVVSRCMTKEEVPLWEEKVFRD
jgi:hypothetical protein